MEQGWYEESEHGAWTFLKSQGFTMNKGVINKMEREVTEDEWEAIDYLCGEWDWAYE